jgi:hypothetical protein
VAGLGSGVNDGRRLELLQQIQHGGAMPDVEFVVREIFVRSQEALLIPARVAAGAEKIGAHVVVHAVDFPTELAEMDDNFRANETGRAGDEQFVHNSTTDFVPVNSQVRFGIGESTGRWITLCIFIPKGNRVVQLPVAAGRQPF